MKKAFLLCIILSLSIGCSVNFVSDRKPNNVPWGGGAFASPNHQVLDVGFMRLQGKAIQTYEPGLSFQFPSIGVYGGNDHFSIGALIGITIYYRKEGYLYESKQGDNVVKGNKPVNKKVDNVAQKSENQKNIKN